MEKGSEFGNRHGEGKQKSEKIKMEDWKSWMREKDKEGRGEGGGGNKSMKLSRREWSRLDQRQNKKQRYVENGVIEPGQWNDKENGGTRKRQEQEMHKHLVSIK